MPYVFADRKKKGGKKAQSLSIDHDYLSSSYYTSVVNGLAFVENLQDVLGINYSKEIFHKHSLHTICYTRQSCFPFCILPKPKVNEYDDSLVRLR